MQTAILLSVWGRLGCDHPTWEPSSCEKLPLVSLSLLPLESSLSHFDLRHYFAKADMTAV